MVPNKEGIVGRDDVLIKNAEGSFQLRRARRQPDQRALLRILDERTFSVFERQHNLLVGDREPLRPKSGARQAQTARSRQKFAPCYTSRSWRIFEVHTSSLIPRYQNGKAGRRYFRESVLLLLPVRSGFVRGGGQLQSKKLTIRANKPCPPVNGLCDRIISSGFDAHSADATIRTKGSHLRESRLAKPDTAKGGLNKQVIHESIQT